MIKDTNQAYSEGVVAEIYGEYADRIVEYRFATDLGYNHGLLRKTTPVLDIGCRNPYEGMLRYLREFAWEGKYVGIDIDPPVEAMTQAMGDELADLYSIDVDGARLPFPPIHEVPKKLFAVCFCIETIEHFSDRRLALEEMQRVAGSVVVIAPNKDFEGDYPANPLHERAFMSVEDLEDAGFQYTGYVNFNGRRPGSDKLYPMKNGKKEHSSEVWGVWLDHIAVGRGFGKKRKPKSWELAYDAQKKTLIERGDRSARPALRYVDAKKGQ